ncbi:MAG: DegQ family serine endoprotease [Rhodospirillales bacterium]|nr:DegQ family serine endoprotease [Rhodospirillales bacterium]
MIKLCYRVRGLALASLLLAGTVPMAAAAPAPATAPATGALNSTPQAAMPERLPSFTHLVAEVKPAVVSVTNYLKQRQPGPMPGAPQLPFPFNQFPFNQMVPHPQAVEARGSGFIIDQDGLIVTNNHVVKDADRITVTFDDGKTVPAKVIGTDPRTDIALLKVEAGHPLPYLQLGDSDKAQPGEWVIAIGNPFGLSETVTAGIISALGRNIGAGPYDKFIQVDAPINEGNSGGPLLTQDGKVIGMNTAILSPTGGSIGIGFSIPSNIIRKIADDLRRYGHVTRGYIGVEAQSVSDAMSKALNLPRQGGALIAAVQPNTPAERAGLKPGDVITAVNGAAIKSPRDLADHVAEVKPGAEANLDVIRDGKSRVVTVTVAAMPSQQAIASEMQPGHARSRLGLALGTLSPGLAGQLNLPEGTDGALVTAVKPGSPAQQAGISPGDVIVGVGSHPVHNPVEAAQAIDAALKQSGRAVALRIMHNGQPAFVAINLAGKG